MIFLNGISIWPSREFISSTMPASFKANYPQTRVIIDCTELFTEMPSEPRCQSATFSTYKHYNTAKRLIGISPRAILSLCQNFMLAIHVTNKLQEIAAF